MANPFDDPAFGPKSSNPFDDPDLGKPRGKLRALADTVGIPLAKGIIGVPETAVGLLDIPTGGAVGKGLESAGVRFKDAKGALDEMLSPEQQAINKGLQETKGFLPTVGYALSNPSTILGSAVESTPSMLGGGAIGRGAVALAPKLSPLVAGAIGEGAVSAGQNAEQVRQETPSGYLSPQQAAIQAGSGALTGLLGAAGGGIAASKLGQRLGLTDIDTALVRGSLAPAGKTGIGAAVKRVTGGVVSEGLIEELPQSAQEQIAQNLALGKPWAEGVPEAAAMGALVGGVMGGGANVFAGQPQVPPAVVPPGQTAPPPSNGATVAPLQPAQESSSAPATGVPPPVEAPSTPPIQRDETGASIHPVDTPVLSAQPGPIVNAGVTAVTPQAPGELSAAEQARVQSAQVEQQANAEQDQKTQQATQEAAQQAEADAEVQRRAGVLQTILDDKKQAEPTAAFVKVEGNPSPDELKAIKAEQAVRTQQDREKTAMQAALEKARPIGQTQAERAAAQPSADSSQPAGATSKTAPTRQAKPAAQTPVAARPDSVPQPDPIRQSAQVAPQPVAPLSAAQSASASTARPVQATERPKESDLSAPNVQPQEARPATVPSPTPTVLKTPIVAPKTGDDWVTRIPVGVTAKDAESVAENKRWQQKVLSLPDGTVIRNKDGAVYRVRSNGEETSVQAQGADGDWSVHWDSGRNIGALKDLAGGEIIGNSYDNAPGHNFTTTPNAPVDSTGTAPDAKGTKPAQRFEYAPTFPGENAQEVSAKRLVVDVMNGDLSVDDLVGKLRKTGLPRGTLTAMTERLGDRMSPDQQRAMLAADAPATPPPQPANAVVETPAAKSTVSRFIPALVKAKSGGAPDSVIKQADRIRDRIKAIDGNKTEGTPGRKMTTMDAAFFIAEYRKADPVVKPLAKQIAEHAIAQFPDAKLSLLTRAEQKSAADAEKKAANKAAMDARREAAKKGKSTTPNPARVGRDGKSWSNLTNDEEQRFDAWRKKHNASAYLANGNIHLSAPDSGGRIYRTNDFTLGDALRFFWKNHVDASTPPTPTNTGKAGPVVAKDDAPYTINNARYAKEQMLVRVTSTGDGFKTPAAYIAEQVGGRYSNRENGYIMSPMQARRFESLVKAGGDTKKGLDSHFADSETAVQVVYSKGGDPIYWSTSKKDAEKWIEKKSYGAGQDATIKRVTKAEWTGEKPTERATIEQRMANVVVMRGPVYADIPLTFKVQLAQAEGKGERAILSNGVRAKYALYFDGSRTSFDDGGTNVVGESSGAAISTALRNNKESDIIAMTTAARDEINAKRAEREAAEKAEAAVKAQNEKDAAEQNRLRAELRERLEAVKFTKAKITLSVSTGKDGGKKTVEVDAWTHGGVGVHRGIDPRYAATGDYVVTHINTGLSIMSNVKTLSEAKMYAARFAEAADFVALKDAADLKKPQYKNMIAISVATRTAKDPLASPELSNQPAPIASPKTDGTPEDTLSGNVRGGLTAGELDPKTPASIQDAGEKIGGARKDKWAERGLTVTDLEGMSGGEESQYVTKSNVWKPDFAGMVTDGVDPKAAALLKIVYDRLAPKPANDTPDGRRVYLRMMNRVKDAYADIKTVEGVDAARSKILADMDWQNKWRDPVVRAEFQSAFKNRNEPFHIGYAETAKAAKMVADGFPNIEPWQRRFRVTQHYDDRWTVSERGSRKIVQRVDSEAAAIAAAKELYDQLGKDRTDGKEPERPHLDKVNRTGEDIRNGRDVNGDDFIKDFGFRGVEFGNWAASDERQRLINFAYDAMHDLAQILKIPDKAVSLNGSLGLALGARGGGRFAAHYEPGKLVINITKLRGAGSLAHEWGHAVDHYFGELGQPNAYQGAARGASGWMTKESYTGEARPRTLQRDGKWVTEQQMRLTNLRPEMAKAFDGVMTALFERDKTKAEAVREAELRIEQIQGQIDTYTNQVAQMRERDDAQQDKRWIKEAETYINRMKMQQAAAGKRLADLNGEDKPAGGYGKIESSYSKEAKALSGKSGDYWKRPTEMFARAFESFVFDRIKESGNTSDYLVHGVEPDRFANKEKFKGNPYPTAAERTAIDAAFDNLFQTIETKPTDKGIALANAAWYSPLSRKIADLKMPQAPAAQWTMAINALSQKGVTKAEIEATGITDWLALQTGKVSKEAIQAYLDANGVQVTETMLGEDPIAPLQARIDTINDRINAIVDEYGTPIQDLPASAKAEVDALTKEHDELADRVAGVDPRYSEPKFTSYQLPGGQNYKELLLTLPAESVKNFDPRVRTIDIDQGIQLLDAGQQIVIVYTNGPAAGVVVPISDRLSLTSLQSEYLKDLRNGKAIIKAGWVDIDGSLKPPTHVTNGPPKFQSGHFDQPNILAHIRFNERTDADGKRVLFIEEIQSDWAQKGKKEGFADKPIPSNDELIRSGQWLPQKGSVPTAPFVTNTEAWVALSIKRMIRYASENGFDRVAWTTGEQQAARYDLSKQVSRIGYTKHENGKYSFSADVIGRSQDPIAEQGVTLSRIEEMMGKEIARKMEQGEGHLYDKYGENETRELTGLDLKVGGEGMKAFYDRIVPNVANKVLSKLGGGKVGELPGVTSDGAIKQRYVGPVGVDGLYVLDEVLRDKATSRMVWAQARRIRDLVSNGTGLQEAMDAHASPTLAQAMGGSIKDAPKQNVAQPGFDITPALRNTVMQGVPLFAEADRAQSPGSNLDANLFTLAAQSPSIKPLLEHIILHSKSPLNKVIARALLKSGINPKVRVGNKYAENPANLPKVALHQLSAMYTPTEDGKGEVTLFNMRTAEHDSLHEAAHAATYAAIRKGGMAARQLEALYAHVKKFGTFDPEAYGLEKLDEFIAEAMSNPDFQRELRGIPPIHGMKVRSAWDWFVTIVRNILGLDKTAHNALSQALEIGNALMIEGRGINGGNAAAFGNQSQQGTRAFREWFRGSRVVDADGNPLVVYHGTIMDFDQFKMDTVLRNKVRVLMTWAASKVNSDYSTRLAKEKRTAFFTSDPTLASDYASGNGGNVMPVYLSMKRPIILDHNAGTLTYPDGRIADFSGMPRANFWHNEHLIDAAKRYNADGIIIRGAWDHAVKGSSAPDAADVYVVFRDTQIKSATGNNGDFSGNPSILANRAQTFTKAFRDWFGKSAVVDETGEPLVVYHGTTDDFDQFINATGEGLFFTASKKTASSYASFGDGDGGGNVRPVYLALQNPLIVDDPGGWQHAANYYDMARVDLQKRARDGGHDGIIVRSVRKGHDVSTYVAFDPSQIKSATGNSGNFDRGNPSILANAAARDQPEWVKVQPKPVQDALRKAGVWAPKMTFKERINSLTANAAIRWTQGLVDQFAPLKAVDERSYMLARLTKSSDAGMESLMHYGVPFLNKAGALDITPERGGLISVLQKLNGEHDRFFAWIAGNRAAQLKAEGKENLFTADDISALKSLNEGQTTDGKSRAMLYAQVRGNLNRYSKAVLDVAEKSGIINGEDRAIWEKDFYVPFYRVMEDDTVKGPRNVSGLTNQWAFKKLRGGTDNLSDLMANSLRNWSHLLSASLKNQAATASLEAATKMDIAYPIKESESGKGDPFVLIEGRKQYYSVQDPYVLDAITALEASPFTGAIPRAMAKFKHALTLGVTISPTFRIRNLIRDSVQAIAANDMSYNIGKNLVTGWKATNLDMPIYGKMMAGGALMHFGTGLEGDSATHTKRLIDAGIKDINILDTQEKVKGALTKAWDWWEETGSRSENITRAALYQQTYDAKIAEGASVDEAHLYASYASRDSMDFSLQGSWPAVRLLSQTVPFWNARLQGMYKLGREGFGPATRVIYNTVTGAPVSASDKAKAMRFGAVVGATALASIALLLAYRDDKDWLEREEWDRDQYWWFKIGNVAMRIPKPFEVGALASIAERGLEMLMDGMDNESRYRFTKSLGGIIANNLAMNPVPQVFKPMIDVYANTNSFTGRPIETQGMERLSKGERISPNTSGTARILGKAEVLSPVQIDSLIQGYFGWLGAHATMTADLALRPIMGLPNKPAMKIGDVFTVGDFVKDLPSTQSRFVTEFYDQAIPIQQAFADYRHAIALGQVEKAAGIAKDKSGEIQMHRLFQRTQLALGKINQQARRIEESTDSPEVKRTKLDQLAAMKNRMTEAAISAKRRAEASR